MKQIMPQEIEVWYLIPSLRKKLSEILVKDYSISKKDAANSLGITNSAVSQYVSKKRGGEVKFSKKEIEKIRETAEKISKNKNYSMPLLYELSKNLMGSESVCKLHKRLDPTISKKCSVCTKNLN